MSATRMWEVVCDSCEDVIAMDLYLTEARRQVKSLGGVSRPGLDLCVKCISKHHRKTVRAVNE